jgi:hypothetical protein
MEGHGTLRCPSCGHGNRRDRRHCTECGAWSDGTFHLLFELIELLERLAALFTRRRAIHCAKLHHANARRCIHYGAPASA